MQTIETKFLLNNPYFRTNGNTKEVYLYVQLNAHEAQTTQKRLPLNISLVIDRSGSMEGNKIKYAKKAADFVINQLGTEDVLSIIQYDDVIETLQAAEKVKNKEVLLQKIAKITARNMTNLSGGMMEGYNQTRKFKQEGYVNRVLMLSDGLANVGVTQPEMLNAIAKKVFQEEGIGLSTFGVGADFDEKLMTDLSENGGANYYFIESPDKIPNIFAQELEGLLAIVAQNAKLSLTFDNTHFHVSKVYGYPYSLKNNELTVNFNDIFSKEEKAVLIRLDVIQSFDKEMKFDLAFSYDDVHVTMAKVESKTNLFLRPTTDNELYESGVNSLVLNQIALFVSNDIFENAMLHTDRRDFASSRAMVRESLDVIMAMEEQLGGEASELVEKQKELIKEYESKIDFMEQEMSQDEIRMSQKMSKSSNYMSRKRK